MSINVADKKRFLNWFVSHVSFSRREVSWILNYLTSHETILKNVCFVEHAEKTPRGILVQAEGDAICLFLQGKLFRDSDQIFHEIRLNWKEPMYLECLFPNCWSNELFLAVLEDNPHYRWNETLDQEMVSKVESYFSQADIESKITVLYGQIDEALEKGEQTRFLELSAEVNHLLVKKSMVTK